MNTKRRNHYYLLRGAFFAFCIPVVAMPCSAATGEKTIGVVEAVRRLPEGLRTPNRYALVVGVGQYQDGRIPKLPAGANDAKRLDSVLTSPSVGMFTGESVTFRRGQGHARS